MTDAWHQYGGDLAIGPSGDIALARGSESGQQRVLRRLLTNPGDYLWSPTYGAGLGRFVGQPVAAPQIEAVIRGQMFKEAVVARQPEPVIAVVADQAGKVFAEVRYADAAGGNAAVSVTVDNG
ncbi:MAG: phage tail protein [Alphaproteobacteria bacterium]|nr:phage tail protein [Alphaproteobacteria bacterium]